MAPSMASQHVESPHQTAGPSTVASSTTSPTGTHSTEATTVGPKQRSWDEDKFLNLYILDYCRRRKFDDTASAFEREAHIPPGSKTKFDAPQGLLFEWWIVFWETFNSQIAHLAQPGHNDSGQVYVNTMARLKKLAMHEKDESNRARAMSMGTPAMSMGTPAMAAPSATTSTMSTPAMASMPNPRPQSQASARIQPMSGPQGQRPIPANMAMHNMTPPAHVASTPSPTPPQSFSQQPFGFQSQFPPNQPPFQQFPSGNPQFARQAQPFSPSAPSFPNGNGPPGPTQPFQSQQFPPNSAFPPASAPPGGGAFPPGSGPPGDFQPASGPPFQRSMPDWGQRPPPMGQGQAQGAQVDQMRDPNRRSDAWEDGRPRPGGPGPGMPKMMPGQGGPPGAPMQPGPHPDMQGRHPGAPSMPMRYMPQHGGPGGPGGPPPHMMGMGGPPNMGGPSMGPQGNMPPGAMGGPGQMGPQQMNQPSPKPGSRSVTPQTQQQQAWSPGDQASMNMRRSAIAAQGGQMGPSGMQARSFNMPPGAGQKRPGSPPPPPTTNLGNSPPDAKRPRPNDPGPGVLVDSRAGVDGRPTSSKGGMTFPGQPGQGQPGMHGQPGMQGPGMQGPGMQPGMMNGQPNPQQQQRLREYSQGIGQEMRSNILNKGVQPPPFGKGAQANGFPAGPGPARGPRPPDAPSPASGDAPPPTRQLINVKGPPGTMGPPASPSLTHRNVGGVKKSESANSSPALPPSTMPNGMGDRSQTPQQPGQQPMPGKGQGAPPSPMPGPATRPHSAQPMNPGQGPSMPMPPSSAPPMLPPSQSPSNGMVPFKTSFNQEFDFEPEIDFGQLTSEFFPDSMDQILNMGSLNEWPNDDSALPTD